MTKDKEKIKQTADRKTRASSSKVAKRIQSWCLFEHKNQLQKKKWPRGSEQPPSYNWHPQHQTYKANNTYLNTILAQEAIPEEVDNKNQQHNIAMVIIACY